MNDNELLRVLDDAATVLERAGLRYALIGGLAAILHGATRTTRDVDLSLALDDMSTARLTDRLSDAGFRDIVVRGCVVQAVHENTYRLDIIIGASPFEAAVVAQASRRQLDEGRFASVATVEDVIAFKVVGGRPRDLRDIEELAEVNPNVDWTLVARSLALVGVDCDPAALERAVAKDELRPLLKDMVRQLRG